MIKCYIKSRMMRGGTVLLASLAALLIMTRFISVSYAATHVPITAYSSFPASLVGKIYTRNPSGAYQECTGVAMASANGSVVATAAHCFY